MRGPFLQDPVPVWSVRLLVLERSVRHARFEGFLFYFNGFDAGDIRSPNRRRRY